jgi:hypothetical protein
LSSLLVRLTPTSVIPQEVMRMRTSVVVGRRPERWGGGAEQGPGPQLVT